MIADEPIDWKPNKTIMIRTTKGDVYVSPDFIVEQNIPLIGMVRITDQTYKAIYWFNLDHLVWIGPRE